MGHGDALGKGGCWETRGWQAFCLGQVDQGRHLREERSGLEVQSCREVRKGNGVLVRLQRGSRVPR